MSRQGSGQAPGNQRRPTNRRRPPQQAYHEDSYQRSSSHELSDDDTPRVRAGRHVRIPGLTPHDDSYRRMPSISSQLPQSFTTLGQAGSAVGGGPFNVPLAQHQNNAAASGLDTEGQDPSWPYRQPAQSNMFTPASTRVSSYPMELDIPSGLPARIHAHREPIHHPTANGPEAMALDNPRHFQPRTSQPLGCHRTQSNDAPTSPQPQQPQQRLSSDAGPSTITGDYNNRTSYNRSAPRRRPRDCEDERP